MLIFFAHKILLKINFGIGPQKMLIAFCITAKVFMSVCLSECFVANVGFVKEKCQITWHEMVDKY